VVVEENEEGAEEGAEG